MIKLVINKFQHVGVKIERNPDLFCCRAEISRAAIFSIFYYDRLFYSILNNLSLKYIFYDT